MLSRSAIPRFDIWPGFVDVLAAILMVFVFLLLVFVLSYGQVSEDLIGSNRAISFLHTRINGLADQLSMAREDAARQQEIETQLRASLTSAQDEIGSLTTALDQREAAISQQESELATLKGYLADSQSELAQSRETSSRLTASIEGLEDETAQQDLELAASRAEVERLTSQIARADHNIAELNRQLAAIQTLLQTRDQTVKNQATELESLGQKLNLALASEVQELQKARSAFFGRLREIIGQRADIRVEGDRFIFQSEVLFPTASAELDPGGKLELASVAHTIKELLQSLPNDIDWVIQVQGHSDNRPIATAAFPSNWELAAARAIAVTRYFIELGVPAHRLSAASYGETRPVNTSNNPTAWRTNRRIEMKIESP